METQKTLKGTMLKMAVNFRYPSDTTVTLDTIDFRVEFFTNPNVKQTVDKEHMIREETECCGRVSVNWFALVDTSIIGAGKLRMRMYAEIPDENAPEGKRVEYAEVNTNVSIDVA